MHSVHLVIWLAFVTQNHAEEVVKMRTSEVQHSQDELVDKLVGKLVDRARKAVCHHGANLNYATLAKAHRYKKSLHNTPHNTLHGIPYNTRDYTPRTIRSSPKSPKGHIQEPVSMRRIHEPELRISALRAEIGVTEPAEAAKARAVAPAVLPAAPAAAILTSTKKWVEDTVNQTTQFKPLAHGAAGERPWVIAVFGPSCSGKSCFASHLYSLLTGKNKEAVFQDSFFKYEMYEERHTSPFKVVNGHNWRDWETPEGMDYAKLIQHVQTHVQTSKSDPTQDRCLVIEGFSLFAKEESSKLFDLAIHVDIDKETAWNRRLQRAQGMSHLPGGMGDPNYVNYEVIQNYAKDEDKDVILADAKKLYPEDGDYAWLHMYFDEVIWPTAIEQHNIAMSHINNLRLPWKSIPSSDETRKDEWMKENGNVLAQWVKSVIDKACDS